MSTSRAATPGKTRSCPHCRSEILESAAVCPACLHHLRFDAADQAVSGFSALSIDGSIRHPGGDPWEYTLVVAIRNEKGEVIARKALSVGALAAHEQRSFSVSVEVTGPAAAKSTPAKTPVPAPVPAPVRSALPARPAIGTRVPGYRKTTK
jgi:hypothetical protein